MLTKEVRVPIQPTPCKIPAFHIQEACGNDVICLLIEFARTLQAEKSVLSALLACPSVSIGESQGPKAPGPGVMWPSAEKGQR